MRYLLPFLSRFPRVHRLVHPMSDEWKPCLVCRFVWWRLDAHRDFRERLRAAEAELEAGGGVLYHVVDGRLERAP